MRSTKRGAFPMWRPCRGSPSRAKLVLSLHIKGLSYESPDRCQRRGCLVFPPAGRFVCFPTGEARLYVFYKLAAKPPTSTLTPTGRVHNGVSISHGKTPQDFRPGGFAHPCPSGGKGLGLYPQITVLRLSNHPAWRDEGGVMNEVKPFSGLPWPGVRGGILPPVSFQP